MGAQAANLKRRSLVGLLRCADKPDKYFCQLRSFVFLQEVTCISDLYVLDILRAGNPLLPDLFAAACDRIAIAESR